MPTRREGDERPFEHEPGVSLTFWPAHGEPFRWKPAHGEPLCIGEWLSQHLVRFAPLVTLVVVIISLAIQVWVLV